jgi:hypothetical protein
MDLNPEPLARYLTHYFTFVTQGNNLTRQSFCVVYFGGHLTTLCKPFVPQWRMALKNHESYTLRMALLSSQMNPCHPCMEERFIHLWFFTLGNELKQGWLLGFVPGPIPLEFRSHARTWPRMGPHSHNSSILNPYPTQSTLIPNHTWCQLLHSSNTMEPPPHN